MVIVTIVIILKCDVRLIAQYRQLNKMENDISAKVFDVISNVTTVIILRIENWSPNPPPVKFLFLQTLPPQQYLK